MTASEPGSVLHARQALLRCPYNEGISSGTCSSRYAHLHGSATARPLEVARRDIRAAVKRAAAPAAEEEVGGFEVAVQHRREAAGREARLRGQAAVCLLYTSPSPRD